MLQCLRPWLVPCLCHPLLPFLPPLVVVAWGGRTLCSVRGPGPKQKVGGNMVRPTMFTDSDRDAKDSVLLLLPLV